MGVAHDKNRLPTGKRGGGLRDLYLLYAIINTYPGGGVSGAAPGPEAFSADRWRRFRVYLARPGDCSIFPCLTCSCPAGQVLVCCIPV